MEGLRLLDANPASHLAAHHAAFSASAFCEGAIDFAEAAVAEAWQALHLSLTFS